MEQSAFEAVMIGVNVFIFIIALTAGIFLMNNILNMVNYANQNAIVGMNGSLAETVGIVNDRIYEGKDLLTYYRKDEGVIVADKKQSYYVRTPEGGSLLALSRYIDETDYSEYIGKKFILSYYGIRNSKPSYVFTMQSEQVVEE